MAPLARLLCAVASAAHRNADSHVFVVDAGALPKLGGGRAAALRTVAERVRDGWVKEGTGKGERGEVWQRASSAHSVHEVGK